MTLAPGSTLAHYQVIAPLGRGAMGEVWRARDTRLQREVALKVLPERFAEDAERVARLEREARTLASLSHPNVAAVFGLERAGASTVLVMELVPGEDLAERLERGALPLDEALDVARRIADGLEAAHEAGVVHRDLKPANVRLSPDGAVKLIDFGLARPDPGRPGSSAAAITIEGVAVGSPAYMAPEQARGRPVDRRADVWALGCVLFECLTARRAFEGGSVSDTLAAVLTRDPDWSLLPASTPPRVVALLRRCLEKELRRRLRDAGDARVELELALEGDAGADVSATSGARSARGGRVALGLASLAAGAVLAWAAQRGGLLPASSGDGASDGVVAREVRASLPAADLSQWIRPRVAPDGGFFVWAEQPDGPPGSEPVRLVRRELDRPGTQPLPGTEGVQACCFSPEGDALAAVVRDGDASGALSLVRVDVAGGRPPLRLGPWPANFDSNSALAWLPGGRLVGSTSSDALIVFELEGGTAPRTVPVVRTLEDWGFPTEVHRAWGDEKHVLCVTYAMSDLGFEGVVTAVDVESGVERVVLRQADSAAVHGDTLLFARGGTLLRAPLDREAFRVTGPAVPIADGLYARESWRGGFFDVARDGTLVWFHGGVQGSDRRLVAISLDGTRAPFVDGGYAFDALMMVASDGSYVCNSLASPNGLIEQWGSEPARPALRRLVAVPRADVNSAHPLAGGALIYQTFGADGARLVRTTIADPSRGSVIGELRRDSFLAAVAPDGVRGVVVERRPAGVRLFGIDLVTGAIDADPFFESVREPAWPRYSPDGRWLAHGEGVRPAEIVVRAVRPDGSFGTPWFVPTAQATRYVDFDWVSDDGVPRLVLLGNDDHTLWEVSFDGTDDRPAFGEPRSIIRLDAEAIEMGGLRDGRVLVIERGASESGPERIEIALGLVEPL